MFLEPALPLIDGEIEREGPRLSALVDGTVELVTSQLLLDDWDLATEARYEREWMPEEALADVLAADPISRGG